MSQLLRLRVVPFSFVALEQYIGFPRAPATGRILRHGGGFGCAPDIEDGVDERPGGLDAVAAVEKRGVAAHTIVEECRVSAACNAAKPLAITEVHCDVADAHLCSRPLRAKRNGDAFIGLNVQYQPVGLHLAFAENDVRRAPELDHDFRGALGKALAGSKIERNTGPSPIVDQQFGGNKGLGPGGGVDAGLLAVAGHGLVADFSGRILAANDVLRHHSQIEGADRLQDLQFFVADGSSVERGGRFYGDERGKLQDVALNHVTERARGFVETAAALDAQSFGGGDLDVIDVIPVPKRLEYSVAKAENEQILDGILAEVVIDAVDLLFVENIKDDAIQFFCGGQVPAKRFFDDD